MKSASGHDLQLAKWLGGAALGAFAMYMLDPERGAPRRALSGEKLRRLGRQTGSAIDQAVHQAGARARAAAHALPELGHALAEGRPRPPATGGAMRGASLAGASMLGLGGLLAPRSRVGMAMGLAGLALLVRASGRHPVRSLLAQTRYGQPLDLEHSVEIDATPEQLFDLFADLESFPSFMANVVEVRDLGQRRSHWVVKGPAGSRFAWNAVLTEFRRPHMLAWESEAGAEVEQFGHIAFEPGEHGTRVTVRLAYRPPAGKVGQALAALLGSNPRRQLEEDLDRMKFLVERAAMAHAGARPGPSGGRALH